MISPVRLLILALITAAPPIVAAKTFEAKPRISENEVLRLVSSNQTISNRTIPATALIKAMRWLQEKGESKRGLSLSVSDCTVEGSLTLYEGLEWSEDSTELEDEDKTLLKQKSVDELLPPYLGQPYKDGGFSKVIVIPFNIYFTDTKFLTDATFILIDTVFQGHVRFENVDFGEGYLRFDNSTFTGITAFDMCTFGSEVSFAGAIFNRVNFSSSRFKNGATFQGAIFKENILFDSWIGHDELRFDDSAIFNNVTVKKILSFNTVTFGSSLDFANAEIIGSVFIDSCTIEGDAFFPYVNNEAAAPKGKLAVHETVFSERTYFNHTRLAEIEFFPRTEYDAESDQLLRLREVASPVVFAKRAIFTGLNCNRADLHDVEFRDYADLSETSFATYLDLSNTAFEGGVNFFGARFPTNTGTSNLLLNGVQFSKGVTVDWSQLSNSFDSGNIDTLRRMEAAFKQLGDLEGQNEVMYRRRYLEGSQSAGWRRIFNRAELALWGYGVRPMRLLGWIFALFGVMTIIYWTQTRSLATRGSRIRSALQRLRFALAFSLRTSWSLGFGFSNARTRLFQTLTLIHSIAFKILFILLLQAFANTSPLLNQLVGKLIHI